MNLPTIQNAACRIFAALMLSLLILPGVRAHEEAAPTNANSASERWSQARAAVIKANPDLLRIIARGGSFNSEFSQAIANNMYSRSDPAAIAAARAKLKVEPQGERSWLLRLPFVNIAVFETDAGLVLVDSGYAPAGPVLKETLAKLSSKPVHTIIHSHYHADHAWGAWALMETGPGGSRPRIVATDVFAEQLGLDLRTTGLIARQNQQKWTPKTWADAIAPSETFHGRTVLKIGGEDFVLTHARGETEDQLWVAVPSRRIVVSADYYQAFMPNAGNGRRRQRFPEEWAQALRQMADLKPTRLLTMHGPAVSGEAEIRDRLTAHATLLETIAEQVVRGLNAGQRVDQIIDGIRIPAELANRPDLKPEYSTIQDIGRMVVKQYSGWWDDIPSHWTPAPMAAQGRAIADLAGGARPLIERAKTLVKIDPALGASLADWAWLAAPDDAEVLRGVLEVYGRRSATSITTQEALAYLEHMTHLRLRLDDLTGK